MTPPRLPKRLTQWIAPADLRQTLFDDLDEAFEVERQRRGPAAAKRWYWRQVLGGLVPLVRIRAGRALGDSAERRRITIMQAVTADVRYAIRVLVKAPGFTLPAVVTLALGIGANTAIFTVAWRLILQPLPYPSPDRLVQVWELFDNGSTNTVTPGNFTDWRTQARSFESIAAYSYFRGTTDLTGAGEPEQLELRYVTEEYCRVFASVPLLGRGLDARDIAEEARTVVISESLWRRRFGADPGVLGRAVRLGDLPYQIVGVMPAAFQAAAGRVDVWAGMSIRPDYSGHRRAHYLGVVARLKPGVSVAQADDDVKRIAAEAARLYPESNAKLSATVRSLQEQRASNLRDGLVVLAGAAGVVLLIACANLASLQFVRGVARARELGVRVALGASRVRLIRQLLTESLMLSLVGTGLGVLVGSWLLHAVGRVAPDAVRRAIETGPDLPVVAVGVALAILSTVLSATMPAWRSTGGATDQLRQRNWSGDRATSRIRTVLVTAEIGLAIVLVIGASLLVMSLIKVLRVDPGFDPRGVLAFDVSLPQERYPEWIDRDRFFKAVFDEVSAIPGVTAVCAINEIPFDAEGTMTYVPEGQSRAVGALPRNVTPGCFDVLKMRVIRGRAFRAHEPARVGIVTENFARSAWPGQSPIGMRVHLGTEAGALIEIVGVLEDSLQRTLDGRPAPQFYEVMSAVSAFQPSRVLLRTGVLPETVVPAVRAAVHRTDPSQPVARLRTLETVVGASVLGRRFDLLLLSSFAIMSLVLAAVGIYGLLAQVVAQRTGEIGIRLALGATGSSVVRLVMRSAWLAVGWGAGLGLTGAAAASQLLRRFMFGVSPTDPRLYLAAAVGLAAVALLAAWLPARRAARVNPTIALRT